MNESKICYCVWLKTRAETITQVNPVIWLLKIIKASFNPVEICSTLCLLLFLLHNALLWIHCCNLWCSEIRNRAEKNVRIFPLWAHLRLKWKETFVQWNNCKAELADHNSPTSFRVFSFLKIYVDWNFMSASPQISSYIWPYATRCNMMFMSWSSTWSARVVLFWELNGFYVMSMSD